MNYKMITVVVCIVGVVGVAVGKSIMKSVDHSQVKKNIKIILGSTREGRSSEKIGKALLQMVSKRTDIDIQLLDLKDYGLPFLNDSVAPMMRKGEITDLVLKKWSDSVSAADAFIIVVPEYNAGYPGVLKNALDLLYKEWNNKPVAFVGYSGGPSGGANVIFQLKQVVKEL
jgi:NAD(P)H-dependent FMN reductase